MRSILYLHGFHSSPYSEKAQIFKRFIANSDHELEVIAPQLNVYPELAIKQIEDIVKKPSNDIVGVVGSSLGGYLATYLHNEFKLPITVVNPAVRPFELLSDYLGPQIQPVTGEAYELKPDHIEQLKVIYSETLWKPEQVWLLQQEGDEVLDYRQAICHYKGCHITLESEGDHSFIGFDRYPKAIVEFLLLQQ